MKQESRTANNRASKRESSLNPRIMEPVETLQGILRHERLTSKIVLGGLQKVVVVMPRYGRADR